jgi:Flp pilus assembly pilin Flp
VLRCYVWLQLAKARFTEKLRNALFDESGSTVAEYALVLVLVTVAVIGVLGQLGITLQSKIQGIIDKLKTSQ